MSTPPPQYQQNLPQRKKPIWPWILLAVVGVCCVGPIVISVANPEFQKAAATARKEAEVESETPKIDAKPQPVGGSGAVSEKPIQVTAVAICADYEANQVAADDKWKGKKVRVTGTIDNIGKDMLDTPFVTLSDGKEHSFGGIRINFGKDQSPIVAKLRKGQDLTVDGTVGGISVTSLMLDYPTVVQ